MLNEVLKVSGRLGEDEQTIITKVVSLVYRFDYANDSLRREAEQLREYKRQREEEDQRFRLVI
ncbi:MAG TPA: hypothetical protein VF598_14050 [Hymenobacter sp.]|jgi:hypothetical protein